MSILESIGRVLGRGAEHVDNVARAAEDARPITQALRTSEEAAKAERVAASLRPPFNMPEDIAFSSRRKGNTLHVVAHSASEEPDFLNSLQYGSVFGTVDDASKNVHLNLVTVNKEGQGVGKGLVAKFGEEAQTHGVETMTGDIRNPKALSNRLKIFTPGRTSEVTGGELFGHEATHVTDLKGWESPFGRPAGDHIPTDVTDRLSRATFAPESRGLDYGGIYGLDDPGDVVLPKITHPWEQAPLVGHTPGWDTPTGPSGPPLSVGSRPVPGEWSIGKQAPPAVRHTADVEVPFGKTVFGEEMPSNARVRKGRFRDRHFKPVPIQETGLPAPQNPTFVGRRVSVGSYSPDELAMVGSGVDSPAKLMTEEVNPPWLHDEGVQVIRQENLDTGELKLTGEMPVTAIPTPKPTPTVTPTTAPSGPSLPKARTTSTTPPKGPAATAGRTSSRNAKTTRPTSSSTKGYAALGAGVIGLGAAGAMLSNNRNKHSTARSGLPTRSTATPTTFPAQQQYSQYRV